MAMIILLTTSLMVTSWHDCWFQLPVPSRVEITSYKRTSREGNRPSMSALAICHQPRIAPVDMGASQYQPSVTPELSALTIIQVQSDGRSVALIGPENGR